MMDLIAISKKEKLVLRDLESSIKGMGFDIIKIRFNEGADPLLQIYVDNEIGAIDIEDCSMISKKASLLLDLEKTLDEDFRLEISSPGITGIALNTRSFASSTFIKSLIGTPIS